MFLCGRASNVVVALASFGLNRPCPGTDFDYRIDRQHVVDRINSPDRFAVAARRPRPSHEAPAVASLFAPAARTP